jgi:NADH-quinone oxidoreductase subunit F
VEGVFPSIKYLRDFNVDGRKQARGSVGVIGGGNSAIDAARVAIRQEGVSSVTIFYRRTRAEMPAYEEEIEAALQEGIKLQTLVSPKRIVSTDGRLAGLECIRNELGEPDSSGRRRPVPIGGSEFIVPMDTLVVAISESSDIDCLSVASSMQIETNDKWGTVVANSDTLATNRPGVFAGGDLVTGPNTIIAAIAAGKKAAVMIDHYLKGEPLEESSAVRLPKVYVEPPEPNDEFDGVAERAETPRAEVEWRKRGFAEVEMSLTVKEAMCEARRCLRCDLEFTKPKEDEAQQLEPSEAGVEAT